MKKFTEAESNVYQLGTPFSNGHRSRTNKNGFLFDHNLMIDIDEIILDENNQVYAIIENKKQQPGPESKLKNILTQVTIQKLGLLELSKQLGRYVFVHIENESKYYQLLDRTKTRIFEAPKFDETLQTRNYQRINTDNKIFLEFRSNMQLKALVLRNNDDELTFRIVRDMCQKLSLPLVEVDDTGRTIVFSLNGRKIGEVPSVLQPDRLSDISRESYEDSWEEIYQKMNLLN